MALRKASVLVVDDDAQILRMARRVLELEGYHVLGASTGQDALAVFEEASPNLVLLDIMMPGMDGLEVCRLLRQWSQVPIIMVSVRDSEKDKVECFDFGADDYIIKPFGVKELLARVRAVLRRTEMGATPTQPSFTCSDFQINYAERRVTVAGHEVRLTPTEYGLLQEMVLNADKVLTHGMLLRRIWGPEYGNERDYLYVFIARLRKEIERQPEKPRHIITIPGVGYQFRTAGVA